MAMFQPMVLTSLVWEKTCMFMSFTLLIESEWVSAVTGSSSHKLLEDSIHYSIYLFWDQPSENRWMLIHDTQVLLLISPLLSFHNK